MSALVRYNGEWIVINQKPFEPERQTYEIAWNLIQEPSTTPAAAYRKWYKTEQEKTAVLYPSFRKDKDVSPN
jgi:hypothetical protein